MLGSSPTNPPPPPLPHPYYRTTTYLYPVFNPSLSSTSLQLPLNPLFLALPSPVRLNKYPRELMLRLTDKLDFVLPGEGQLAHRRFWRRALQHEIPQMVLVPHNLHRYRGPVYTDTKRRVSGKAATCRIYASCRGDLLVVVTAGMGSATTQSLYTGPPLRLELPLRQVSPLSVGAMYKIYVLF